jgi:ferrochelatase
MTERTAIVLLNLGGPDTMEAVEPFLFNLFSDPDIFKLPLGRFTQKPFARLFSKRRAKAASQAYSAIGGKSPLLDNTLAQAKALAEALRDTDGFDVHVCMRYWHPLTDEVVGRLQTEGYSRVLLLPLYPQYSTTTTGSSYNEFLRQCHKADYHPALYLIESWYDNSSYQQAVADCIRSAATAMADPDPARIELLFSAHGLPQKVVDRGDPYEMQVRATYKALCDRLGWPNTTLCYQSRVGPLQWLRPYTEEVIRELGGRGAKQVLVYPIAFVSDHSETLFELGIEYAKLARESGVGSYAVVPALNDHPLLIRALKELVLEAALRRFQKVA